MIMTPYFSIPRVRGKRMSYEQLAEGLFAVRDVFAIWLTGGTKINIVLEFLIKNLSDSKLAYIDHSGALSVFDILSRNSTEIYRNSSLVSIHFLILSFYHLYDRKHITCQKILKKFVKFVFIDCTTPFILTIFFN